MKRTIPGNQIFLFHPVSDVEFFKEKSRERIKTEKEEKLFFSKGKSQPHLRDIVYLALNTGMWRGEILRLKKSAVVLGDLGGFISLKDTKSGDNRKVPLTKELTEFFKQVIKGDWGSEYIFFNNKGKPFSDISQSWEEACRRAGIEDLRFHDLRHTFCTRMAHEGVSPFDIMAIVGTKTQKQRNGIRT